MANAFRLLVASTYGRNEKGFGPQGTFRARQAE